MGRNFAALNVQESFFRLKQNNYAIISLIIVLECASFLDRKINGITWKILESNHSPMNRRRQNKKSWKKYEH